jgi:hypothetical protein
MARHLVALLVALPLTASAAPAYPLVLVKHTPAERAHLQAAFTVRNPQWTIVLYDEHGYFASATTKDPALIAADLATLRDFVRRNADLFGIDPAAADQLGPISTSKDFLELNQIVEGMGVGQLMFKRSKDALTLTELFFIPGTPTLTPEEVQRRVVGHHYDEVIPVGYGPERDCAMGPGGSAGCRTTVNGVIHRDVVLTAKDVPVQTMIYRDGDKVRMVRCIDSLRLPAPERDATWPAGGTVGIRLNGTGGAPSLPFALDAVTGEAIRLSEAECFTLRNLR